MKRENPWAGGRVVDGYARQAFCLLLRDIRTGEPLSMSKLFQRNGSGELGAVKYLSGRLYTRFQPRADRSRYVGPAKRGADGGGLRGGRRRWRVLGALEEDDVDRDRRGRRFEIAHGPSKQPTESAESLQRSPRSSSLAARSRSPLLRNTEPDISNLRRHRCFAEGILCKLSV